MSGPPRVEQAVNLAEELATVSQKYDMNVNKLKRQKVWNKPICLCVSVIMLRVNGPNFISGASRIIWIAARNLPHFFSSCMIVTASLVFFFQSEGP